MVQVTQASPMPDLICLSHLRWKFVFQRPQHLMTRCASERRVYFVEEPIYEPEATPRLQVERDGEVRVVTPYLATGQSADYVRAQQRKLLDELMGREGVTRYILWYYTPMALPFTRHLMPLATVYDCMDELSAFKNAPP